jgi:hypothetical protein
MNTEALLEAHIGTNVYTPTDGLLEDDDLSDKQYR